MGRSVVGARIVPIVRVVSREPEVRSGPVAPVTRGCLGVGGANAVGAAVVGLVAVSNRQTRDFVRGSEGR